ncbi:MAG: c-type cytochrome domain-containing protein, partial [Pirellulaceae bacterium]|nr:c-type cytochrome domain-containing protein [Pirellulaceae bacterium]
MYRIIGNRWLLLSCAGLFFLAGSLQAEDPAGSFFDREVAPLLAAHCAECHHENEAEGKLNLLSQATARKGGENGPALVPGN